MANLLSNQLPTETGLSSKIKHYIPLEYSLVAMANLLSNQLPTEAGLSSKIKPLHYFRIHDSKILGTATNYLHNHGNIEPRIG